MIGDPYTVIGSDGAIYWMLDAYTASNRYPYSEPLNGINYMRNAVKVVVNAYDGTMHFYLVDPSEPIIAAYASIFPQLFSPIETMPSDLLAAYSFSRGSLYGTGRAVPHLPYDRRDRVL